MMKTKYIILFLFILTFLDIKAQSNISNVNINPLNRVIFYFDNELPKFTSSISDDKLQIRISMINTKFNDSVKSRNSSGIINNVYLKYVGRDCEIIINIKEKRGFTSLILPYSNSLVLDVFSWDQLSLSEDTYRTGLLAIEDGINESTIQDLTKSVQLGNPDAAAVLGLALIKMGKINSAQKNLEFADKKGTFINDIYAGLAQICKIKNLENKSYFYQKIFSDKTGILNPHFIAIDNIVETENNYSEPIAHLDSLLSLLPEKAIDTSAKTKVNINENSKAIQKSTKKTNSMFPWWMEFVLYGLLGVVLLIVYFYFKWRNEQLNILSKIKQANQNASKANLKTEAKPKIASLTENYLKKTYNKENINPQKTKPIETDQIETVYKKKPVLDDQKKMEIERFITQFKEKSTEEKSKIFDENLKTPLHTMSQTAKVELALHLAEEQQKIRDMALENLKFAKFDNNNKLDMMAKSMGLEQNSLETKMNMDSYSDSKDKLKDLAKKFAIEEDEDEKNNE